MAEGERLLDAGEAAKHGTADLKVLERYPCIVRHGQFATLCNRHYRRHDGEPLALYQVIDEDPMEEHLGCRSTGDRSERLQRCWRVATKRAQPGVEVLCATDLDALDLGSCDEVDDAPADGLTRPSAGHRQRGIP